MLIKGRRAVSFTSRAVVDYNGDGMVTIDVRRALDDRLQAEMRADVATFGRFESRWTVHATLTDLSWLKDRRGNTYTLNGVNFAKGSEYPGNMLTWRRFIAVSSGFRPSVPWLLTLWQSAGTLKPSVLSFYTIFQHSYTGRLSRER